MAKTTPNNNTQEHQAQVSAKLSLVLLRQIWRRLENIAFGVVFAFIVFYFILQMPWVQNWLVHRATSYLSSELKTEVKIDRIDFSLFDNLILEGLYIQDLQGDTLMYARELRAGLSNNIFSALYGDVQFDEIRLVKTKVNMIRRVGDPDFNLQFVLDYFAGDSPSQPRKSKPNLRLEVKNLWLDNVRFRNEDHKVGQTLDFMLPHGNIRLKQFDAAERKFDIQSIALDGLRLDLSMHPAFPIETSEVDEVPTGIPVSNTLADSLQTPAIPLLFQIEKLRLSNGSFALENTERPPEYTLAQEVIDFDHLHVQNIDIEADSIQFNDDLYFTGVLNRLAAKELSGFEIKRLSAKEVIVCDTLTALYGSKLETNGTTLGDTMALHYSSYHDYKRFTRRVKLDGRFKEGSELLISDIMAFSNEVASNPFFINNKDEVAAISGLVNGRINRLNGRDLKIRLGNETFIHADFDGDDLAEGSDRLRIEIEFDKLQSNFATIKSIIPNFSAPAYFNKLGDINFTGRYDLLFGLNHILDGQINTDIGNGDLDMELDLTGGTAKALYSGKLAMTHFDLASWTGNNDFGNTSFNIRIAEGSTGLSLPTINARLSGAIDTIHYKGYRYTNLVMNGAFKNYVFDGQFGIKDPNVDFSFDGKVNLKEKQTVYDFTADIRRLDLQALNLVDKDWVLSGKIPMLQLHMNTLADLTGEARITDLKLIENKETVHKLDILQFKSSFSTRGDRQFIMVSDIADAVFEGKFNPLKISEKLQTLFSKQHPLFAQKLGLARNDSLVLDDLVNYNLQIKDSRSWASLIDPALDTLQDIALIGRIDMRNEFSELTLNIPKLNYNGLSFRNTDFTWNGDKDKVQFTLLVPESRVGDRPPLEPISLAGFASSDQLKIELKTLGADSTNIVRNLNLNGILTVVDSLWQIRFNASKLALFNEPWYIANDNYVRFDNEYFASNNFELSNDYNQRIRIDSLNNGRGLGLSLTNFDLRFLNKIFKSEDTTLYHGKIYDLEFVAQDVFKMEDLAMYITTDSVFVGDRSYGEITGNFELKNLNSPLAGKLFLNDENHRLRVAAAWLPEENKMQDYGEFTKLKPGEFQAHVDATNFPMHILEQFVPDLSKTAGGLDVDVTLSGPFTKVEMQGEAQVNDVQFQIDYLKSMFYIHNQKVVLNSTQIWAEGDTIWDGSNASAAIIHGGLRHQNFLDWGLDCTIETLGNDFLILNTTKRDNELYYGQGIGRFKAEFTGDFAKTNIKIDGVSGKNTRLFIPLLSSTDAKEVNFITYRNTDSTALALDGSGRFRRSELTGLNIEMNLSVTDDAEVQLIFDEQAGDIVKGRGEGNISLIINREGEFKMYGNYIIKRGEYLFTLLNVVNKPFTVAEGGTINWYGDPYGAQIQLDATYDETTPIYNFISDELTLANDPNVTNLLNEAKKSTRVNVTMHLTGDLFKPDISFDLDFPNLSSRVKSLTDNKLRLLRQDQNEMNRQVFGLVVVGSFLPSSTNNSSLLLQAQSSGINTLTQVFTSQLSNYLSTLAYEWFDGKVSSIDFDIAYNEYNTALNDPSNPNLTQIGRELQVRLTSGFANDRVTVQVGSQFGLGRPTNPSQNGFLGEDITVEIQITQNRQWRVKVYQRAEPDIGGGSRRRRYGFGLSFRKEYDTFDDMIKGLTTWKKKGI